MSPETTAVILKILKIVGLILLLGVVPFLLACLAGWLEKWLCHGIGSFNVSAYSVLIASFLGLVRGLCFVWDRVRSVGWDVLPVTASLSSPARRWTDSFGFFSFNLPGDVGEVLTYLESWRTILLYVIGVLVVLRAICDSLVLTIIPIALVAVVFSYVAYLYSGAFTVIVLIPIGFAGVLFYVFFSAIFAKRELVDDRGIRYREV